MGNRFRRNAVLVLLGWLISVVVGRRLVRPPSLALAMIGRRDGAHVEIQGRRHRSSPNVVLTVLLRTHTTLTRSFGASVRPNAAWAR